MPALFIEGKEMLVISDLHIGIENELQDQGLHVSSQLPQMLYMLTHLTKEYHPKEIVLLGDIKHTIPQTTFQEKKQLRSFFDKLTDLATIHVIPGNHDGNIQWYLPDTVILHDSDGVLFDDVGCFHGHRWPKESLMKASIILLGHTHPTVILKDRLEYETYETCWVKTMLDPQKAKEQYEEINKQMEIIILPAFNPLCGGMAVNKDGIMGPMNSIIRLSESKLFLLDGSYLGSIASLNKE